MSEIKFACPHCGQHIVCDDGYGELSIDCPSCTGMMVVPRLSAAVAGHPSTVIVASTPSPKRPPTAPPQTFGTWPKEELEQTASGQLPPWLIGGLSTLIVAFVLRTNNVGIGLIVLWLLAGSVVSGILVAKGQGESNSTGYRILRGVCLAIIIVPALGLGLLFFGCAAACAIGQ
jgi:hypothetical protein